ncbi:hypothetical protein GCM10028808_21000 [Spirosoma migulaei]
MVNRAVVRNLGKGTKSKAVIDSAVEDIAQHAVMGANRETAGISRALVQGLKGSVDTLNPDIQKAMHLIDSVGQLSNTQVALIMQTVIDRIDHMKGQIKDEQLKQFFMDAIASTTHQIDIQTRSMLANMMMKAIDDLNSDSARGKIAAIRDSLLNDATNKRLQTTILTSVQPTLDTLTNRIDRIVNKNIPIVQRYAYQWLIGLGLVAAAIIGWVWYQRRRYLRIVKLLTLQIDKIPDKETYDELVSRIRHSAQAESLEPVLRTVLQDQGINHAG